MVRYLVVRTVVLAAVINAVVNWLAGIALFGWRESVSRDGPQGFVTDTAVGLALIALLTVLIVTPVTRRDARAGKVAGLAGTSFAAAVGLLPESTFARAVLAALAMGVVGGLGIGEAGIEVIAGPEYALLKGALAAGFAAVFTPVAALVSMAAVPDRRDDPRWLRKPASGRTYPFDYLDKGSLAASSEEHGCSNTPTWQMIAEGKIEPEQVRIALADLVRRYPPCATKARSLDATPEYAKKFVYVAQPDFAPDDVFHVIDLQGEPEEARDSFIRGIHDHRIDLFDDYPILVTLMVLGPNECRLFVEQHHALADGRAFISLLGDFGRFIAYAQLGRRPAECELEPVPRRGELEALGLSDKKRRRYTISGFLWSAGVILRALVRPTRPHVQNLSNDYTGSNGTVHYVFPESARERWREARKRLGVSLNTMLTAALFITSARFSRQRGCPPGLTNATLIAETRPRDQEFESFANHLTSFYAAVDLGSGVPPPQTCRELHAMILDQRDRAIHIKKLVVEHFISGFLPMDSMRTMVMESKRAAFNLNFSNLIPLEFPLIIGETFKVTRVLVSTPAIPRCGIVLTVVRYDEEIVFNFNYKASVVGRSDVEKFADEFIEVLSDFTEEDEIAQRITSGDTTSPDGESPEPPEPKRVLGWLAKRLGRPLAWQWIVALGAVLMLACLNVGFAADDHMHRVSMLQGAGLPGFDRDALDLFAFSTGDPTELRTLMSEGTFSWWVAPDLKLYFWRPVSSATHALDYTLWPDAAWAMYAHNIAWFAGLLIVLAALYRRFHGGWIAALALLLYAIDDAHGPAVGWISNRNAIIMVFFACASLLAHDSFRARGWTLGAVVGPLLFGVALLSAEGAVAALGYLVGYALFFDRATLGRRLASILPYVAVFAGWFAVYRWLGRGTAASGVYLNPTTEPLSFLEHAAHRIPILLVGQFAAPWSEFWPAYPPGVAPFVLGGAVALLGVLGWMLWPALKRERSARFWLFGCIAAAVPIAATFPADRLLMFVGVGAMPLLAILFASFSAGEAPFGGRGWRVLVRVLIAVHLILAPLLLPIRARSMEGVNRTLQVFEEAVPRSGIDDKTVVVINSPNDGLVNYLPFVRNSRGEPRPAKLRLLATTFERLEVKRVDASTIAIRPEGGFLATMAERMLRGTERPFAQGETIDLGDTTITVTEVLPDGRAAAIEAKFAKPLDAPNFVVFSFRGRGFDPYELPAVGETDTIPAVDKTALLRVMLGD